MKMSKDQVKRINAIAKSTARSADDVTRSLINKAYVATITPKRDTFVAFTTSKEAKAMATEVAKERDVSLSALCNMLLCEFLEQEKADGSEV